METTLSEQIFAIQTAMRNRAAELGLDRSHGPGIADLLFEDAQWKALNDAASTIASIKLKK